MKYLVMECHEGYAVLMDEESRFVNAANLHYEVGQTVTDPLLLENDEKSGAGGRRIIMRAVRVAATAACLAVVTVAGFSFFGKEKPAPRSVVFVSAAAEIEMELDDNGEVVRLKSKSGRGNEIIDKYIDTHGKTTDKMDTANDILSIQLEDGFISSGDTVDVFIPGDDKGFETYKSELEDRVSDLDINVNIKKIENNPPHHNPPTPPAVTDNKGPAHETATKPTDPKGPKGVIKPDEKETLPTVEPPTAPSVPEPPVPPVVPDEHTHPTEPEKTENEKHEREEHTTHRREQGPNGGIGGRGPAALPAPELPAAPEAPVPPEETEVPKTIEAPEVPDAHEEKDILTESVKEELPVEADENCMIDSL